MTLALDGFSQFSGEGNGTKGGAHGISHVSLNFCESQHKIEDFHLNTFRDPKIAFLNRDLTEINRDGLNRDLNRYGLAGTSL